MNESYYLDANAHIPIKLSYQSQIELNNLKASPVFYGHPLSPSYTGTSAATIIEKSRYDICKVLGISNPSKLCFTYSCTQANEWACQILFANMNGEVSISKFEHPSMRMAYEKHLSDYREERIFVNSHSIDIDMSGNIKNDTYDNSICLGAQSESGLIIDLEKIRKQTKGLMVCDLAQVIGKTPINLEESQIDIATFGAHKFGGPVGVGCLYLRDLSLWSSYGRNIGTSYGRDIQGTSNVEGIVITKLALRDAYDTMEQRNKNCLEFRNVLEDELKKMEFEVICEGANRISNTTFVRIPRGKGILLLSKLSDMGVFVGLGSACESFMVQDSNVMLGFDKHISNTEFIRISQHGEYGGKEAIEVLKLIKRAIQLI